MTGGGINYCEILVYYVNEGIKFVSSDLKSS